jgi:methylase of polypeptide subunit release factors
MLASSHSLKDIFFCPEESNFYSYCLESLVFKNCLGSESIIEFGSGDGSPVIQSLLRTNQFNGVVHGFELNPLACQVAKSRIEKYKLTEYYKIYNRSFFEATKPQATYLISNPPYLPAVDNNIYQPLLHGGTDGITITKQLLSLNYENVLVIVASYSNPAGLIDEALAKNYSVSNFIVSPIQFGPYSSEPKVRDRVRDLRKKNRAFYSENIYLLAGVLFSKESAATGDLSAELLKLMTCL